MASKVVKSGIWYTASNFIVKGIGIITVPIFTRLMSTDEFGAYSNFNSWVLIMAIFVTLSLEATLISAKQDYRDRFDQYVFSMALLSFFSAVLWLILTSILAGFTSQFFSMDDYACRAMFIYLLFLPAVSLFQAWERYKYEYKKTVLVSLTIAISSAALAVLLVITLEDKLFGRIAGQLAPTILIGGVLYFIIAREGKKVDFSMWKYALPIALPYIPHLLSVNLLGSMDVIMLARMTGETSAALYSLAYSCGMAAGIVTSSIINAFGPWMSDSLAASRFGDIRKKTKPIFVLIACVVVVISLISPEVVLLLGGEKYVQSSRIIPFIVLGSLFQFVYCMYACIEQFMKKTGRMALATLSAAGIKFCVNLALIPAFGILGASLSTVAGYAWLSLVHVIIVWRMGFHKSYDNVFVAVVLIASSIICASSLLLFEYVVLRFAIVGLFAVAAVIFAIKHKTKLKVYLR